MRSYGLRIVEPVTNRDEKRQTIINAAIELMEEKGKDATISEIASRAGVTDSIIYHYFKNKMDLLYYAIGETLQERCRDLERQLQGIREPISRLGKLIWFQLNFDEDQSQYIACALFECRADIRFLQHEVRRYFIRWGSILEEIFVDGVRDGSFSPDLSIPVACAMTYGLLDMEKIQLFTGHGQESVRHDFNEVLDLILSIVTGDSDEGEAVRQKGVAILEAAEKVFAEKGYDRATTVEIAKKANVAEGTLYEYFENKEDILFSALQHRFKDHLDSLDELFEINDSSRKLRRFIQHHFMMYLRDPAFLRTFISEGIYNRRFYESKSFADFQKYLETIDHILEEGQKNGSFRPDLKPRLFKNLFLGAFSNLVRHWYYPCGDPKPEVIGGINEVISMLMKAVTPTKGL